MHFLVLFFLLCIQPYSSILLAGINGWELKIAQQKYVKKIDWHGALECFVDSQCNVGLLDAMREKRDSQGYVNDQPAPVDGKRVPLNKYLSKINKWSSLFSALDECACVRASRARSFQKRYGKPDDSVVGYSPVRTLIEEKIIGEILKKFPDKKALLIYTSIVSGLLYQDAILISKLLKAGYRNIRINLIYFVYDKFLDFIKAQKITELNLFKNYPTSHPLKAFLEQRYKVYPHSYDYTYKQFNDCFVQFKQFLANVSPRNTVQIVLYKGMGEEYKDDCKTHPSLKSHIVIGLDITPHESKCILDLAPFILRKNGPRYLCLPSCSNADTLVY